MTRDLSKKIVSLSGSRFAFKYMHKEPTQILAYIGPDILVLSPDQFDELKQSGYEMDKWKMGNPLTYNIKYAESTLNKDLKSGSMI